MAEMCLRWARSRTLRVVVATAVGVAGALVVAPQRVRAATWSRSAVGVAGDADGAGYWLAASDGSVFAFGSAPKLGSMGGHPLGGGVVGLTATPDGGGYWEVAADGGVFAFGDAAFFGGMGGRPLSRPIVGLTATPDGGGYWEVAADGGVFAFGDATFLGGMGGRALDAPVVALASTPDGGGYWEAASDGGVFAFGDATFLGSAGGRRLNSAVVDMASAPGGAGYWLVAADGGIFSYGAATFHGSTGGIPLLAPIAAMASRRTGGGYWLAAQDGGVFAFGDAPFAGSAAGLIWTALQDVASRPECGIPAGATAGVKVIVISLACQELSAYQDGNPVLSTFITTGRPALPTPPGQCSVLRKVTPWLMQSPWPYGSPYWYPPSWVKYTLWFRDDGYAIHDAPWRAAYGPGTELNGSHGCVNVPGAVMPALYVWTPVGAPVRVY